MNDKYYRLTSTDLAKTLDADLEGGLSSAEAKRRQTKYGLNQIEQKRRVSPLKLFFSQFQDFLIIILIVAAVVSILLGERTDGFLILAIVVAVALVGFFNEYKAERTIEALKRLVALKAKVKRDGEIQEVDAKDLVPGDIVLLEEGQKVPADIRLLDVIALQINESSLTGESQPIYKSTEAIDREVPIGDRRNSIFSGTNVTAGKGTGMVVNIGAATEIGHIATLVEEAVDEDTPMQKKLDRLGRQLGYGVLAICAVVFVVIFFLDKESLSLPLLRRLTFAFIAAVALAVAAIPEGLAFVVRISLALGARRMAKRNALIRRLPAVEALGSTDTICSDKTGTLTKGEMTVTRLWSDGVEYSVTGSGYSSLGKFYRQQAVVKPDAVEPLLRAGWLCNNAALKDERVVGDPTEGALLVVTHKAALPAVYSQFRRVGEVPFTSDRKMMTTVHSTPDGYLVSSKGAAEVILAHCTHAIKDGRPVELTTKQRAEILAQDQQLSAQALRVLGVAYRVSKQPPGDDAESNLVFAGLVGMMDPPRAEIKETIAAVTGRAGIRVIMITGDHIETAKAVAEQIGLKGQAISGSELDKLSQAEFEDIAEKIAIYARVNPEHKIRIVQALQRHGHQVAMTGDGVNDAPAIKAADIGIAMGITGTDVAKEAADVILLDDHFVTIVNAIEEGRGIFDNVRKFVNYLVSCNIAEVLIVTFGVLLYGELILVAIQLLFINIVTDGLPAVALGSDPAEKQIMDHSPKRFQTNIVNRRLWLEMTAFGIVMTILIGSQFAYNLSKVGLEHAVAVAFTATVVLEMVRLVNLRSDYRIGWASNPWLIVAIMSSLLLQMLVVYWPFLSHKFRAGGIGPTDWVVIAISSVILVIVMKLAHHLLLKFWPDEQPAAKLTA